MVTQLYSPWAVQRQLSSILIRTGRDNQASFLVHRGEMIRYFLMSQLAPQGFEEKRRGVLRELQGTIPELDEKLLRMRAAWKLENLRGFRGVLAEELMPNAIGYMENLDELRQTLLRFDSAVGMLTLELSDELEHAHGSWVSYVNPLMSQALSSGKREQLVERSLKLYEELKEPARTREFGYLKQSIAQLHESAQKLQLLLFLGD